MMTPQEAYEIRRQATSDVARRIPAYDGGSTVRVLQASVAEVQEAWDALGDTESLRYCPAGLGGATPEQLDALLAASRSL